MDRKPRLFIGSSVESLPIADAINENLNHTCEVTIWRNGTFKLANNTIDSLVDKAAAVDFAVFIFSPDDLVTMRDHQKKVVRDNVIFELGLFIGTIGKKRSFIVKPRNVDLHFPTDLLGITTADFEPNRSDGDIASALNLACTRIKREIEELGVINNISTFKPVDSSHNVINSNLNDIDFSFLTALLSTITETPTGLGLWHIKNALNIQDPRLDISSIKLEKLGYIQKENDIDPQGYDYYAYKLSQNGLEFLLNSEDRMHSIFEPRSNDFDLPF